MTSLTYGQLHSEMKSYECDQRVEVRIHTTEMRSYECDQRVEVRIHTTEMRVSGGASKRTYAQLILHTAMQYV